MQSLAEKLLIMTHNTARFTQISENSLVVSFHHKAHNVEKTVTWSRSN